MFRILTDADVETIAGAVIEVLEKLGFLCDHGGILSALEKAGSKVDHDRRIATFSGSLSRMLR